MMVGDDKPLELILKIQVPHMGILKTMRTSTGYKVAQLTQAVIEKLETAEKQDFSHFGLYWYNETGPLWLADNSFLRAYGFKNGDTLQFKAKPSAKKPLAASSGNSYTNPNPSPRFKTASVPAPIAALPSVPSYPVQTIASPKESTHKPTAKEALLKAFQVDTKLSPPPPSNPVLSSPTLASPASFGAPLQIPTIDSMQKSLSSPSPTHRAHSVTAPPKPYSHLTLSVSKDDAPKKEPTILEEDESEEVKLSISPRKPSPIIHHSPPIRAPPSPDSPPSQPDLILPHLRSDLPRIPSQSRRPSESAIQHTPSLLDAQPRVLRAQSHAHDTRQPADGKVFEIRPLETMKSIEKSKTTCTCSHKEDYDRERGNALRLKQRIDLTECILTDTLQAIEEGESDTKAIKMYLNAALASLRKEDVHKISFGGTMKTT